MEKTFNNITYFDEKTSFEITHNELIITLIQPEDERIHFSISKTDAIELANMILSNQ